MCYQNYVEYIDLPSGFEVNSYENDNNHQRPVSYSIRLLWL